jgi:phosphoglycerol transferase MdoB-like AlkP superfamily enzyme
MSFEKHISSFRQNHYAVLILRLVLLLLIFAISRMTLCFFNADMFSEFSLGQILYAFLVGFRFDFSILMMIAALLILGNTLPLKIKFAKFFRETINSITIFMAFVAISFNLTDAIYYRYTLKRMTFDIFSYIDKTGTFWDVAPQMMIDYWYTWVISVLLLVAMIFFFRKLKWIASKKPKYNWQKRLRDTLVFVMAALVILLGIRGGFQLKPINIVDAAKSVPSQLTPLVLNTPFTIVKSYGQTGLEEKNYFEQSKLNEWFDPLKSYQSREDNQKQNVVVIILESFSSEHIGFLSGKRSFTPFLDSLFEHSLAFRGTANGKRSIEGIPAILSSLPTLSDESFLNSPYAANSIEGMAHTLDKYGYTTAFFHGGKNGTMSFDSYAKAAGFQRYYGKNEYPNPEDFDGHWGIWDEEFLQFFKEELSAMPQPFLGAVFTLSSHHPFSVPERYAGKFPRGDLPIQQCIAYTDHALKLFFKESEKEDWFFHTLFVITADHTSEGSELKYQNNLGQFGIPIAFYAPVDAMLAAQSARLPVQQTDILPSVLDYLGVQDILVCFGSSVFDSLRKPFAVNYFNQKFQILDQQYLLQSQSDKILGLYEYQKDSLLKHNLLGTRNIDSLLDFQKAFIQQYNNRMIYNQIQYRRHE